MKQATLKNTVDVLHKIENLEKELMDLRLQVLKKFSPSAIKVNKHNGKKCSLAGIIDIAKDCTDTDLSLHHDKYLYIRQKKEFIL